MTKVKQNNITIDQNNHISIHNRVVGRVLALTWGGQEQKPTGSKQQVKTSFYRFNKYFPKPTDQTRFVLDVPVFVLNKSGLSCYLNPDLEDAIIGCLGDYFFSKNTIHS